MVDGPPKVPKLICWWSQKRHRLSFWCRDGFVPKWTFPWSPVWQVCPTEHELPPPWARQLL